MSVGVAITASGVVSTAPETSTLGLEVTNSYKITASALDDDGSYHYELTDSEGNLLASGVGDSLTDALLGMAIEVDEGPRT